MTLTILRRLVAAGAVAALLAAGGAAWYSTRAQASTRPKEEWDRLFPRSAGAGEMADKQVKELKEYVAAAGWVQGEKPKPKTAETPVAAPPPDPFQYRLVAIWAGGSKAASGAQIQPLSPAGPAFTMALGEQVPTDPGGTGRSVREWRLDDVVLARGKDPARAVFTNIETGDERVLSVEVAGGGGLDVTASGGKPAADLSPGVTRAAPAGQPAPDQKPRFILLKADRAAGNYEYEVPEEEADFLGFYGDREAAKVSVLPDKDGFIIKSLESDSRAASMGFKKEDRVVSVNGEKVTSTEQALGVGKRQYEGGTSTFVVKVQRAGKEMNFTFHAPKKKGGGK